MILSNTTPKKRSKNTEEQLLFSLTLDISNLEQSSILSIIFPVHQQQCKKQCTLTAQENHFMLCEKNSCHLTDLYGLKEKFVPERTRTAQYIARGKKYMQNSLPRSVTLFYF